VEKVFARSWRTLGLRGVVSLVFGVIALVRPSFMLTGLVLFFGVYAFLDGLMSLGTALRHGVKTRIHLLVLEAVIGLGAGIAALIWTNMTTVVLVMVVGFWAIATGVLEAILAQRLWGKIPGDSLLALAGLGSIVAGVLMTVWPRATALVLTGLLGGYAVFFGTTLIALALRLRQVMPTSTRELGARAL
jgi:uncharacterized membrane protein HdeD (DUF308 family)